MRKLVLAFCLVASICAYKHQQEKYNFDIVIESIEYKNIPSKYNLEKHGVTFTEEDLKNVLFNKDRKAVGGTDAILNDYADKIFTNIQHFMIHQGFDPLEMPDLHSGFNYTLIITYHGEIDLTNGWLEDLSTIHRGGDVVVSYSSNSKYLEITVPIAFDDMAFTYDYSAKIMGLGPSGGIEGKINSLTVEVKLGFNTTSLVASLDEFYITNAGHISFHFTGNPLVDWLINLLTGVVTTLLKEVILLIVEDVVRGGLQSVVDLVNDIIGGIINPTTAIPTTTEAARWFA